MYIRHMMLPRWWIFESQSPGSWRHVVMWWRHVPEDRDWTLY